MKGLRLILFLAAMMAVVPLAAADKLSELRQKADALHAGGKNDSALIVAREALDMATKSRNTTAIVGINSSMGVYLRTMGKTDEALRHYNEAMKLCTTAEFKAKADEDARQEAAALYLNLATLHIDMQHKKEAMYYAGLSVDWTQKCADKAFKAQMLSQNGLMFLMAGDNNKAADMLKAHLPCTVADGLVSRDRGDLMHGHVDDFHRASSHVFYLFPGTLSALRNE